MTGHGADEELAQALYRALYDTGVSFDSAHLIPQLVDVVHAAGYEQRGEVGSCWDRSPTISVPDGVPAPAPLLCELPSGHAGAHRNGVAEWILVETAPAVVDDAMVRRACDEYLAQRAAGPIIVYRAIRATLIAALTPDRQEAKLVRKHPEPETPSVEQWAATLRAERERQIAKGYDGEHDQEHGVKHLVNWAIDYGRRGETVKSHALMLAVLDLLAKHPEPEMEYEVTYSSANAPSVDGYALRRTSGVMTDLAKAREFAAVARNPMLRARTKGVPAGPWVPVGEGEQ